EQPPVSQGFMVLEMLNIIEAWPMDSAKMTRSEVIHCQVGAKKLAFEDRIRHLEDPTYGDPQISMLISKEYAAKRRALIGDPILRQTTATPTGTDTTFLCAADRDGNAISLIQSVFAAFGSKFIAGDSGVIMNNRLCGFGLDPTKANSLKSGKRPAHTLNTYMVFRGNELFAAGWRPGTAHQPQSHPHVPPHLPAFDLDPP